MSESNPGFAVTALLETLFQGHDLREDQAREAMEAVIEGRMGAVSLAALLVALRAKGEAESEIAGFAAAMREKSVYIHAPDDALDTCGTGGDRSDTFNISTATALVVAAMGIPVAKHGNRSVSSKSGSADVLRTLGVNVEARAEQVEKCIREAGIGFLFAPALHPGMKHAVPVRRELGVRTVFNLLGPLSNPARAKNQLLGVFDPQWCEPFARVLQRLGSRSAIIVCGAGAGGEGHLDEVSTWGPTTVARLSHDVIKMEDFIPASVAISTPAKDDLFASDPEESARIIKSVLNGDEGPAADVVAINASAAAQVAGKADTWQSGLAQARQVLKSGKAAKVLEKLIALSNQI